MAALIVINTGELNMQTTRVLTYLNNHCEAVSIECDIEFEIERDEIGNQCYFVTNIKPEKEVDSKTFQKLIALASNGDFYEFI